VVTRSIRTNEQTNATEGKPENNTFADAVMGREGTSNKMIVNAGV